MHAQHGIFILYDPKEKRGKKLEDLEIYDVSPTVLSVMGIDIPEDMEGKVIPL